MSEHLGVSITLDLIQVFAAWYGQEIVLEAVRERLQADEESYDKGENAAFAEGKLYLIVEGKIDLKLDYISDAKNEWKWQCDEDAEVKLALTLDINFRAGRRFYVSNGALDVGGKAVAEGGSGLEKKHSEPSEIDGLKEIAKISSSEMAYAEGTTTGMIFVSTDFPAHVLDKSLTPTPIDWSKYTLMTYNHGRLFRMGGYFQNSPLGFNNSKGKPVFGYSPYFSIINGQIILVR